MCNLRVFRLMFYPVATLNLSSIPLLEKKRTGGQQCHLLVRMSSEVEEGEAGWRCPVSVLRHPHSA